MHPKTTTLEHRRVCRLPSGVGVAVGCWGGGDVGFHELVCCPDAWRMYDRMHITFATVHVI